VSNRAIFRLAVIGILLFDFAIVGIAMLFDNGALDASWELLPEFIDWYSLFENHLVILVSSLVFILAVSIISLVGVLMFKAWGRWLYLGATISIFPISVITGPAIFYGWEIALFDFANMFHGAVILSMFLQPIANEFKTPDAVASFK
jgi:hypothetical protein